MLDHSYSERAHKTSQNEMQAWQSFAEHVSLGMMLCDVFSYKGVFVVKNDK